MGVTGRRLETAFPAASGSVAHRNPSDLRPSKTREPAQAGSRAIYTKQRAVRSSPAPSGSDWRVSVPPWRASSNQSAISAKPSSRGRFRHTRIHVGVFVGLAGDGRLEVQLGFTDGQARGRITHRLQVLQVTMGVAGPPLLPWNGIPPTRRCSLRRQPLMRNTGSGDSPGIPRQMPLSDWSRSCCP